jgi:hypothetical protein
LGFHIILHDGTFFDVNPPSWKDPKKFPRTYVRLAQQWRLEGWNIPPQAIVIKYKPETTQEEHHKKLPAKYCVTGYGTGWLVIVAYDVKSYECQHGRFQVIVVHLPPGQQYYMLKGGWSIKEAGA